MFRFLHTLDDLRQRRHVALHRSLAAYATWQLRKLVGGFPFEQRLSESVILARSGTCGVSALVHCAGMYDHHNMHLLVRALRGGGSFFDVGANIGAYTLIASEQAAAQVTAFEPHPRTFEELAANVSRNRRTNVTLVASAVGAHDGPVHLRDGDRSATNRIVTALTPGAVAVPCVRLDSYCARTGVRPDVVKIDVEGAESDVVAGLGQSLRDARLILVEQWRGRAHGPAGATPVDVALRDAGFTGPFRFDAEAALFHPAVGAGIEDDVFVSSAYRTELERSGELGFTSL